MKDVLRDLNYYNISILLASRKKEKDGFKEG